ncbi:Acetyl-CoA synthetase [hydrothermal vent metagenome]|uniref:Acetyl-CoA synthetase n=1 Tax=hydrothermal vent metagenome TaxID=652676 RepID=A0A3B0RU78_9ZZZZ
MKISMSTERAGFCGPLPPSKFNLAQYCLQNSAATTPDKVALIICDNQQAPSSAQHWTYQQIEDAVLHLAGGFLSTGLNRGERLFIRMGNSFDFALVFFAANAAGLVPVPASSQLTVSEVEKLLADCGASAIASDGTLDLPELPTNVALLDRDTIESLKQSTPANYCQTHKDDPAFLVYTSGTTSVPKGVLHAQRAVWGRKPMYRDWYDIGEHDRLLHTGAFNWTYTLGTGLFDPWANGATSIVYTGEKNIDIWPAIIKTHQPTIMAAVPSLYRQILKYCQLDHQNVASLRHCLTAGEPLPENIRENWLDRTGLELYEALGMSEVSTYISSSPARAIKRGSPGQPQSDRCIAILPKTAGIDPVKTGQPGVIAVHRSDPGLMLGYWNRPDEEATSFRGDWFLTGDLARMDSEGFIWFEGRNDDLINAMGYRVSPIEVEAVLSQHKHVDQVGVCAINLRQNVDIITGFLVPVAGTDIDIEDVARFASSRLAAYKVPKKLLVVDSLPCNASGKLLRKELPHLARTLRETENG